MGRSGIHVIADCHTKMLKSKQSVLFTFRRFFHLNIGGFLCDNGAVVYSTGPVNSYLDTCCVVPRGP
jgi:hypothetical protein